LIQLLLILIITAFVGGFLSGLIGIGGGTIYVIVLPFFLDTFFSIEKSWYPQLIIANSIFVIQFASLSASFTNIKKDFFFYKPVLWIAIGVIIGLTLAYEFILKQSWFSYTAFLIFETLLFTLIMVNNFFSIQSTKENEKDIPLIKLIAIGFLSGSVSTLSGLGGGVVIVPILNNLFKVNFNKASSISLGVIFITAVVLTFFNLLSYQPDGFTYSTGLINWPIVLALSSVVVFASPLGVKVARKLPQKTIGYIYTFFIFILIVKNLIAIFTK
jgi:uncharacterized membrane protein YfcA